MEESGEPPKGSQKKEITSHPGPRVWERKRNFATFELAKKTFDEEKPRENKKHPWELQKLMMEKVGNSKVVGLPRKSNSLQGMDLSKIERTEVGSIKSKEEYWKLYESHAAKSGYNEGIGHFYGAAEAKEFFEKAESLGEPNDHHGITQETPEANIPLDAPRGTEFKWCRGTGTHAPEAGCLTAYAQKTKNLRNTILAEEYSPGRDDLFLLPLVTKLSPEEEQQEISEELDKQMRNDVDQGAAVVWNFKDWGLPTAVVPARVIFQPTPEDPNRHRAVKDHRYPNSIINKDGLFLPDHIGISIRTAAGDCGSKQDLKGGYHQVRTKKSKYHLVGVSWRGRVYAYVCMSFGLRDAPREFQKRTSLVAKRIGTTLNAKVSEVYLDDFIQIWEGKKEEKKMKEVKEIITNHGFVISTKKCKGPCDIIDILGLELDIDNRKLKVSEEKSKSIGLVISKVQELGERSLLTTKDLAQLLGKLVSVEPAMPHLMLLTRQLFEELKNALVDYKEGEEIIDIRGRNDASSFVWGSHAVDWNGNCRKSLEFIKTHWNRLNGQNLDPPGATTIIRTDASDDAFGGRALKVKVITQEKLEGKLLEMSSKESDKVLEWKTVVGNLTMDQATLSSTTREAWAIWYTVSTLDDHFLKNRDVVFATDNQGLAKRLFKGSVKMEVNEPLLLIVERLLECNAQWSGAFWMRRTLLTREDALSREQAAVMTCKTVKPWFESWNNSLPKEIQANIDLFAKKDDRVLERFACDPTSDEGGLKDGVRIARELCSLDVPYIFPPTNLLQVTLKNWEASASATAHFVVPASNFGKFNAFRQVLIDKYGCKEIPAEVEVPWYIKEGTWTFFVLTIRKKNDSI